jgi:hypothetical protein
MNRVKTQFFVVAAGLSSARVNLYQNGQIPKRVIIGLVKHSGKSGAFIGNPFRFEPCGISAVELLVDGLPVTKRFEPDFARGAYARDYVELVKTAGKLGDSSNGITYAQFANGRALWTFNMTGDLCNNDNGFHLISVGSLSLNLTFATATTETLSVVVYSEKTELVTIDPENRISTVAGVL